MRSKPSRGDLEIIGRIAVFQGLKRETIEQIVVPAITITLPPHEVVCRQGELATAFFIILEGCIKVYRLTLSGAEAVIRIANKGDSFAEAAAFTGSQFLASAESVGGARVVRIPVDHVVRCIQQNPTIALAMLASASCHIHQLLQEIEQLKSLSGVQRVAEFLISLSAVHQGPSDIALPYGKELIARQLGLRPESLSRAFAKLKSIGVMVHDSNIKIDDIERLCRLAAKDRGAVRGSLRIH